eukprot:m.24543 g.24543  ORF g.24543 m.24543 type:complete len:228 (+) comp7532_c0_seq2:151-834(+)
MGQAITHIRLFNRSGEPATVTVATTVPQPGQPRFVGTHLSVGQETTLDVGRNQIGSVSADARAVLADGTIVQFRFGVQDEEVSDQVIVRKSDVLYNTQSRGSQLSEDDLKEQPQQRDTVDANSTIKFTNGTAWNATVTVCLKGQESEMITALLAPAKGIEIDVFGRLKEVDTPTSVLVAYDNGTQVLVYLTVHKPVPGECVCAGYSMGGRTAALQKRQWSSVMYATC